MPYTPPAGDDLVLVLGAPLPPRTGANLVLVLADDAPAGVVLRGRGSAYRPPLGFVALAGSSGLAELRGSAAPRYYPPLRRVDFGRAGDAPDIPPVEPAPEYLRGTALPWAGALVREHSADLGWDQSRALDRLGDAPWREAPARDHGAAMVWELPAARDHAAALAWDRIEAERGANAALAWAAPPAQDRERLLAWVDSLGAVTHANRLPWLAPPARDREIVLGWADGFTAQQRRLALAWDAPQPRDHRFALPWTPYLRAVQRSVDPAWEADPDEPDPGIPLIPPLGIYTVNNAVSVVRLPERTPIRVLGLRAESQLDNTAWSLSLALADAAGLALLDPGTAGPRRVEVSINGWTLVAVIESYGLAVANGRRTWAVEGRSPQVALGAPYATPRSLRSTGLASAQQLATDELENSGFTLDWQLPDWIVPAGAWSYDQLPPLDAVARLATAVGGRVQSDPAGTVLRVISRYPVSPWDWPTATPDAEIALDAVLQLSARWRPAPAANAVYLSGGNQGVEVNVKRQGTAGDVPVGTVVDALITDVDAGTERGRIEIARTGDRIEQGLAMPVLAPVGVLLPGTLLRATSQWTGLVTGVAITVQRGEALDVQQQISVERAP